MLTFFPFSMTGFAWDKKCINFISEFFYFNSFTCLPSLILRSQDGTPQAYSSHFTLCPDKMVNKLLQKQFCMGDDHFHGDLPFNSGILCWGKCPGKMSHKVNAQHDFGLKILFWFCIENIVLILYCKLERFVSKFTKPVRVLIQFVDFVSAI